MTLLKPLGLIGLISIIVLIIIYIIKPIYQQKLISSTFVWKLSLKYRKKKLPTSKLRNILLIICQVLILTACATILAQPMKILKAEVLETEVIAIIDSSASMRAGMDGETRFERAVLQAKELSQKVYKEDGIVSIIIADDTPTFLAQRTFRNNEAQVIAELDNLLGEENDFGERETLCSYGVSDVNAALTTAQEVLEENPKAKIVLYTDQNYPYVPQGIEVVKVTEKGEWNAAILNASAIMDQNYYAFYVDVACYGRDEEIAIRIDVHGANAMDNNDMGQSITLEHSVDVTGDMPQRVIFMNADLHQELEFEEEGVIYYEIPETQKVFAYQSIDVSITTPNTGTEKDAYGKDNFFCIYGGQKEVIKVQYASSLPNSFFASVLLTMKSVYSDRWDIQVTEVKRGTEPALEGFDFYLFEHKMPEKMPSDGVVFLANPDASINNNPAPAGSGIKLDGVYDFRKQSVSLTEENAHPLLTNVTADNITISRYVKAAYDASYQTLLTCDTEPVLLVRNEPTAKVVVMAFSLHYSNLPIVKEFPLLMHNVFEYFWPATVEKNAYEVYEKVELNARGEELFVTLEDNPDVEIPPYTQFPATMTVSKPGKYVLKQQTGFGENIEERIYVTIPMAESNIFADGENLENPYANTQVDDSLDDLLLYIAAALVALLFIEWWLQSRESL